MIITFVYFSKNSRAFISTSVKEFDNCVSLNNSQKDTQ